MQIAEFNQQDPDAAREIVRVWADVPGWIDTLVAERPFASSEALAGRAAQLAAGWTEADLDHALAQHPRIGDRVTAASAEGDHSRREQAAMSDAGAGVAERIAAGNVAYEERFGRVFLIRAAGRSPEQMLAELERRLGNAPDDEWREAAGQLAEIATLRIRQTIDDAPAAAETPATS